MCNITPGIDKSNGITNDKTDIVLIVQYSIFIFSYFSIRYKNIGWLGLKQTQQLITNQIIVIY